MKTIIEIEHPDGTDINQFIDAMYDGEWSVRIIEPVQAGADYWLIWFEDADRKAEVFSDEAAARHRYRNISTSWNAHLFQRIDCNHIELASTPPHSDAGDLAALVRQLVRALRKAAPDHDLPARALDYLKRNSLQGSPLRAVADDGIEQAAKFIERRLDGYIQAHSTYDPDTGATEFPGNGDEYVGELAEIIEGIRALAAPSAPMGDV
jgi:hypothetical protein